MTNCKTQLQEHYGVKEVPYGIGCGNCYSCVKNNCGTHNCEIVINKDINVKEIREGINYKKYFTLRTKFNPD